MKKFILFIFIASAVIASCSKDPIGKDQFANFSYQQTQCADPWPTGTTDSLTLVNVANYLNAQGVTVSSLSIKLDGQVQVCLACQCKTGKTIYASVLNSDSLKIKITALGFTPN